MKTLVIVGAGKGLGLSVAKRFGREGFQVALMARNTEKLQSMVDELNENGIEASCFVADIFKKDQIEKALDDIKAKYGKIDVLEFSPLAGNYPPTSVLELTGENAKDYFEGLVISAINIVNNVIPDMIERGEGSLLFTTGLSAVYPIPMMSNAGIAQAGLRNYLANLRAVVSPKGILVANRSLGVGIKAGTGAVNDPEVIAEMWYQVYSEKLSGDEEYPKGVTPATIIF